MILSFFVKAFSNAIIFQETIDAVIVLMDS